jgi:hypothetical protein
VHGTLHLLGFDHEREADAELMEGLETEILRGSGLRTPMRDGRRAARRRAMMSAPRPALRGP